jgi:hypothetical protein
VNIERATQAIHEAVAYALEHSSAELYVRPENYDRVSGILHDVCTDKGLPDHGRTGQTEYSLNKKGIGRHVKITYVPETLEKSLNPEQEKLLREEFARQKRVQNKLASMEYLEI